MLLLLCGSTLSRAGRSRLGDQVARGKCNSLYVVKVFMMLPRQAGVVFVWPTCDDRAAATVTAQRSTCPHSCSEPPTQTERGGNWRKTVQTCRVHHITAPSLLSTAGVDKTDGGTRAFTELQQRRQRGPQLETGARQACAQQRAPRPPARPPAHRPRLLGAPPRAQHRSTTKTLPLSSRPIRSSLSTYVTSSQPSGLKIDSSRS